MAYCETCAIPERYSRPMGGQTTVSFFRRMEREKAIPITGSATSANRMVVNGIAISSTQPSASTRVSVVKTPSQFQSSRSRLSSARSASSWVPSAPTSKM